MSKCGKSFLPECEYFTTGGCISPFNCPYKMEHESITTATSTPLNSNVIYTEETYKDKEIARLTAENEQLRARLENATELPCKVGDTLYMPWVYDGTYDIATLEIVNIELTDNEITYITDLASDNEGYLAKYNYGNFSNGDFDYIVFTDYDKAEIKLKELQGGAE